LATIKQLENWLHRTHERVEKFKSLLNEETTKKKELVRPKTPEQVKEKEGIIRLITRYRDELNHSKKRKTDLEGQLKKAKQADTHPSKKAVKTVEKALTRKFNQLASGQSENSKKPKKKAADNRIRLPKKASATLPNSKVEDRLQAMEGRIYGLEEDLKVLQKLIREGNAKILKALRVEDR
jgi:hypothetical protein